MKSDHAVCYVQWYVLYQCYCRVVLCVLCVPLGTGMEWAILPGREGIAQLRTRAGQTLDTSDRVYGYVWVLGQSLVGMVQYGMMCVWW